MTADDNEVRQYRIVSHYSAEPSKSYLCFMTYLKQYRITPEEDTAERERLLGWMDLSWKTMYPWEQEAAARA